MALLHTFCVVSLLLGLSFANYIRHAPFCECGLKHLSFYNAFGQHYAKKEKTAKCKITFAQYYVKNRKIDQNQTCKKNPPVDQMLTKVSFSERV